MDGEEIKKKSFEFDHIYCQALKDQKRQINRNTQLAISLMGKLETIDEKILSLARTDEIYNKIKSFIADETDNSGRKIRPTRTINLIEFSGNNKIKLEQRIKSLCKIIELNKKKSRKATGYYKTTNPKEINDLWNLRKKGVGLLGKTAGERKPIPL